MSAFYPDNDRVGSARGRSSTNCHCASPRSVRLFIAFEHHFRGATKCIQVPSLTALTFPSLPCWPLCCSPAQASPPAPWQSGFQPMSRIRVSLRGMQLNAPDLKTARKRAIAGCHKSTGASAQAKELCKVIATFSNQCFAIALDPKDGTPGVGWSIAENLQMADKQALDQCRTTAGPTRVGFCVIVSPDHDHGCDGSAK